MTNDHRIALGSVPRALAVLLAAALLIAAAPLAGTAFADPPESYTGTIEVNDGSDGLVPSVRYAGANSLETAGLIATTAETATAPAYETDTVVLARADKFPDALAGSRVGGIEQAPILLTPSELEADGGLSPELSAALDELQPETIVQLGDDAAISESVTALLAESYTVNVIGGETRLETAAQISELPFESATVTPETSSVIVANAGDANLVDALSAAAIGAASDTPVLLTFDDALAPATAERLTEIAPDVVYVAGGEASLPESITAQIAEVIPDDSTVEQVAGAERQSTSVAFAELAQEEFGFVSDHANIASARDQNLTDALAFGPHAGLDFTGPAPILVTYPETLAESATAFLAGQDTCFAALHLAGGTEALSEDVEQQAREAASTDCDDADGADVPSGLFGVTGGPTPEVVQFGDDGSETRTPIVNVPAGLEVVGADVRSSTGLVYVLTDDGSVHIVTINEPGDAATVETVGNVNDDPQPGTPAGTATAPFDLTAGVGFDFNPSGPNALRIVTADGVNLRVAFDADGAVATTFVDGDLAYSDGTAGEPAVTGAAYTDNAALGETATATSLYDLDTAAGTLVTQAPANDGTLQTVGDLGVAASEVNGFDIVSEAGDSDVDGNAAYAALTVDGAQALYEVDLETGATTPVDGGDFDETFVAVGFLPQTTTG